MSIAVDSASPSPSPVAAAFSTVYGRCSENARWDQKSKRQRAAALQDAGATDCTPLLPRGFGVRLSSAAFLAVVQLITGCATNKPAPVSERHFPPNAFMVHRAIFTARGKQFALTGYLALSESGGKRLIISQSLGQTMADLLVKPDGTLHVMQASPMFKEQWIRRFIAADLECVFGRNPPRKCPVQMLDPNHFLIKHFWYQIDLRIVDTKVGTQPEKLFEPTNAQNP